MKTIKDYTDEELRYGIERCKARLSGVMPKGMLNENRIKEALKEYNTELQNRGVILLDFKES